VAVGYFGRKTGNTDAALIRKDKNRKRRYRCKSREARLKVKGTNLGRPHRRNRFEERRLCSLSPLVSKFPIACTEKYTKEDRRKRKAMKLIREDQSQRQSLAGLKQAYCLKRKGKSLHLTMSDKPRVAYAINLRALGFRKDSCNHRTIVFLAFLLTVDGANPPVVRQVNWLYGYLRSGKPHGFLKHIHPAAENCWRYSHI
jgi:hypothetical protein